MTKTDEKYTDPELRDEIKEKVKAGDKGGQPGQWSARKAQMMASEYKKAAHEKGEEPYKTAKKDETAKHLDEWTKEEWQTSDGSGKAKRADGTEKRYLPKRAWEQMSDKEKAETNAKKLAGSKDGHQHVANTAKATDARRKVADHSANKNNNEEEDKCSSGTSKRNLRSASKSQAVAQKRKLSVNDGSSKKTKEPISNKSTEDQQKANSPAPAISEKPKGKNDSPPAPSGSADRLPKIGATVYWHALPGWCEGTVLEVLVKDTKHNGKTVKASKDDPRIVLKSSGPTGKKAVHKAESVYFK